MDELKNKALELGASDLGLSQMKHKKYFVIYNDKKINFGSAHGKTFLDHKDKDIRANWIKRHSQIKDKNGIRTCNDQKNIAIILELHNCMVGRFRAVTARKCKRHQGAS